MSHIGSIIADVLIALAAIGCSIWVIFQVLRRSEDAPLLISKWLFSLPVLAFMFWRVFPEAGQGGMASANGVFEGTLSGLALALIWRRNIASLIANPFGNLYDGGSTPPEARPFYSTAIAQRKRGHYTEALASIRKELERFPTDFEGQMLVADIQAENLNDLQGAAVGIQRICNQEGHPPGSIAMALNTLADWYLKYHQDRDSAREALQRIIELLPNSEMSLRAAQRIGSLASTDHLVSQHDRKKFAVVEGVQNLGLLEPRFHPKPADADAAKEAAELVEHLHAHPLDAEARERLAAIYAHHYNRLDLATDQLEQLIVLPNQPQKRVVHFLNFLADLQVRYGATYDTARATVQRIIDLYPGAGAADVAANRLAHLKLEFKKNEKSQGVKLGSYEQDIGLKRT